MNKSESAILEAKTPEEYIDRSLKAKLTPAAKARLARTWMKATGYSKEDILRARNRHPYWKRKKMEGSAERTRRRLSAHDYSGGASVDWNRELVAEFLGLNGKDGSGRYEHKDWQLAERFGATIPSIQYMRRKYSKVQKILGARAASDKMIEYLLRAESVLSRGKGAVEELRKAERGKGAPGAGRPAKAASSASAAPSSKAGAAKKGAAGGAPVSAGRKAAAGGAKGRGAKAAGKPAAGKPAVGKLAAGKLAAGKPAAVRASSGAAAKKPAASAPAASKGAAKSRPAAQGRPAAKAAAASGKKRRA